MGAAFSISQNNSDASVTKKAIECRSDLITAAVRQDKTADKRQLSCSEPNKEIQNKGKNNSVNETNKKHDKQKRSIATVEKTNHGNGKENGKGEKLKVMIVGDSQLRRVDESKLKNDQRVVEKRFKPGMKIKEAASLAGKSSSDVIIIHAGTNNVDNSSPEQLCEDVVETLNKVQANNPKAIGFSAIFRRKDDQNLNTKVTKVNTLLEDELALNGIDIIDNSNIFFSNLWKDGLHINDGGVRKFSGNLSRFIKYC